MGYYHKRFPYDGHVDSLGNDIPFGEENDGSSQTEQSGCPSSEQQVRMMMQAGERLQAWREGFYDYKPGENLDPENLREDRTRVSNYDLTDAALDQAFYSGKLVARRKYLEEQVALAEKVERDAAKAAEQALSVES